MNTQSATELLEQEQLQVHQQIAQAESEELTDEQVLEQERRAAELEQSETNPSAQD